MTAVLQMLGGAIGRIQLFIAMLLMVFYRSIWSDIVLDKPSHLVDAMQFPDGRA